MGMRLNGIASGLDTESIVKELMAAKSLKKTNIEKRKTKHDWKMEKWAELNAKIYKLYTDQASKLKYQGTYNVKKASSSNENVASIKASGTATDGSYELKVNQLATSQYVTSGKVTSSEAGFSSAKNSTKLSEIDKGLLGTEITIENGKNTVRLQVKENTKVSDLVQAMQNAGLNASFDEKQQRFFISSKESGEASQFSMTTTKLSDAELDQRKALEEYLGYSSLSSADKGKVDKAFAALRSGDEESADYQDAVNSLAKIAEKNAESATSNAATQYMKAILYQGIMEDSEKIEGYKEEAEKAYYVEDEDNEGEFKVKDSIKDEILGGLLDEVKATLGEGYTEEDLAQALANEIVSLGGEDKYVQDKIQERVTVDVDNRALSEANSQLGDVDVQDELKILKETGMELANDPRITPELTAKFALKDFASVDEAKAAAVDGLVGANGLIAQYSGLSDADRLSATGTPGGALEALGLWDVQDGKLTADAEVYAKAAGMAVITGQDSEIELNGAKLTSNNTTVSVNGLTIDLKNTTDGEAVRFSVANDVDATYNLVKDFVKQYNELLVEMNTLFFAGSAKGYEPLTDEEKEAMSDKQIELWETKIKDSLLRNDERLRSVTGMMRNSLMSSVDVNGKKYSLASLGIMTSNNYQEMGLLHIFGDEEDPTYMDKDDKLKSMLTDDPDLAVKILSGVMTKLSNSMYDQMKTSTLNSVFTFYNDKQMKKQTETYEKEIKTWETRLQEMEDRYYKQFTAMEKAMSTLNSQSNYFSNFFSQN